MLNRKVVNIKTDKLKSVGDRILLINWNVKAKKYD